MRGLPKDARVGRCTGEGSRKKARWKDTSGEAVMGNWGCSECC
jgi:hypothetical protein